MSFIDATRQNFTELPSQAYSSGGKLYFTLPKVGLLSRLFLTISGAMTVTLDAGTAAISERTLFNLIKRIRLVANGGTSIYDVSGFGTYLINHLLRKGMTPATSLIDRGIGTDVYAAGVSAGANAWKGVLEIPIAINEKYPIGMVLLQKYATQLMLEVELNAEAGANDILAPIVVASGATAAFVGNIGAVMEYFTIPRDTKDYPPLNVIHQWVEQLDSISSTGVFTKSLLRGNTYMRLVHTLTLANKLDTTDIDKLRILYNQTEVPYTISKLPQLALQRSRYGIDLPKGMFVHDWYMSNGLVGLGNTRDFINSANVTEFQTELTVNSGATVTAGQSFVGTISEQLIKIA